MLPLINSTLLCECLLMISSRQKTQSRELSIDLGIDFFIFSPVVIVHANGW